MKRIVNVFVIILIAGTMTAQVSNYSSGISFKKLFLDYKSQNGGELTTFKDYRHGFELGLSKRLGGNINLYVPGKFGVYNDSISGTNKTILGADAILQFLFLNKPKANFVPYLMAGGGFTKELGGEHDFMIPFGLGLNFRVHERLYVNIQSEYRFSLVLSKNALHHGIGFTYNFGGGIEEPQKEVEFLDSDNDGVRDDMDLCPQVAGSPELKGCPDSDGDGIPDYKDACPDEKGLKDLKGCPDSDGDGVADYIDECPNMKGTKLNKGCPDKNSVKDRDNDGVVDSVDKCPDKAGSPSASGCPDRDDDGVPDFEDKCPDLTGSPSNNGCPTGETNKDTDGDGVIDRLDKCPAQAGSLKADGCPDSDNDGVPNYFDKCPDKPGLSIYSGCPDTDGDGLDDFNDRCPTMAGPVENKGCPKIADADRKILDVAMRAVQFDLGKSTLKSTSYQILNQVIDIMIKYPDYNLMISGHTDNTGSASKNQRLSSERAKACYDYLKAQGISESRMSYVGYGESRPIADNSTLNGRALNRRVEFNLVPGK